MPPKYKLNAKPSSRGRQEIHGGPSFPKKSTKKENMGTVTDQRPCFYEIISDDEPMKRIPSQFLKYMSKESDTVTLIVVSGGLWTVKVKIIENDVFMEGGWAEFVRDNSLRSHDFLVFQYDGNMRFSVKIFDPNGVERIGISSIRMHQESAGISNGKRPKGRPRKNQGEGQVISNGKRPKGRPRKNPGEGQLISNGKRPRGRPRKNPVDTSYISKKKSSHHLELDHFEE